MVSRNRMIAAMERMAEDSSKYSEVMKAFQVQTEPNPYAMCKRIFREVFGFRVSSRTARRGSRGWDDITLDPTGHAEFANRHC